MKLLQGLVLLLTAQLILASPDEQLRDFLDRAGEFDVHFDPIETSASTDTSGNTVIDYTNNVVGLSNKVRAKLGADSYTPYVDTWYLPWKASTATFLRLASKPPPGGRNWFFTAKLTGCEMWIVLCNDQPPILMHINALGLVLDPTFGELETCSVASAQELAARALQTVKTTYGADCRYVHRILRGDPRQQRDLDTFCAAQATIAVSAYDGYAPATRFYGYYGAPTGNQYSVPYNDWTFRVRRQTAETKKVRKSGLMGMFGSEETRTLYSFSSLTDVCTRGSTSSGKTFQGLLGDLPGEKPLAIQAVSSEDFLCAYFNSLLSEFAEEGRITLMKRNFAFAFQDSSDIISGVVPSDKTIALLELFPASFSIGYPFDIILLEEISYNCTSTLLRITTRASASLRVIPGILELSDATLAIEGTVSPASIYSFTFSANWEIGGIAGHFTIADDVRNSQLYIAGGPQGEVTLNFEDIIENLAGQRISLPISSVSFRDVLITGVIDTYSSGSATFTISGKYGEDNLIFIALQKQSSSESAKSKYSVAFASEFSSFNFADLIDDLTGADISEIPFFGSLVVPHMAVTVATADILLMEEFNTELLSYAGYNIPKGVTGFFIFSGVPVRMSYSDRMFSFEVLDGKSISVNALLSQIPGLNLDSLDLPPGVSDLLNLEIESFSLNLDSKELAFSVIFPDTLSFFEGQLTIEEPAIAVHAVLKTPRSISVDISGKIRIGDESFSISISRDEESNTYILTADIGRIDIAKIIQEFGAAVVPDELSSIIEGAGFIQFAINDAHITYPFSGSPQQIQIAGDPEIAGFDVPSMSAIIIRQGGKTQLVQGFELGRVTISDLIQSISGHSVRSIAILNQELEAAILISPVTLPGVNLIGSKLSGFSINKGVSFQAVMQFPPDCVSDAFCAVAQSALGTDAKFRLQGTIASANSFTLTAAVTDLHLGSVILAEAGLEITVGKQVEVGIFGSVKLTNPAITLTGAISIGTRGVVLEMTMSGCWEQAFGVDWLTICSLQVSISLKPGIPLVGFAFGGEIKLGKPSCGNQIQASGFIGIDPLSPQENYYYVNIPGEFTIGSALQAFCVSVDLPKPVADSGFPKGFLSSFSLVGKELPDAGVSIPQGFRLKGTINILGLEASADVTMSLPNGIKMDVSLPPINVAGNLLSMYASSSDKAKGPYLVVDITLLPRPSIFVEASGYVSVLGITAEAKLRITNTEYLYSITGSFLGLFEVNLEITASYGDIRSASFRVRGSFKNDLFTRIADLVDDAITKSAEQATAAINAAQRKVDDAKGAFDDANREISKAQSDVDGANADFDSAIGSLRSAQADVRGLCTPPNCGDVCVPAPCGWTCYASAWGSCIIGGPSFSSCCFRAPDLICEAARAGCIALRETGLLALKVAEEVVDNSRWTLDVAKGVLEGAKGVVSAAKHTLDVANFALEAAKQTYKVGAAAANAVAQFALKDLFNIKEMTFDVNLSAANGGSFSVGVKARILGNDVNVNAQINVRDIASVAKQLAEEAIDGLSSFFG